MTCPGRHPIVLGMRAVFLADAHLRHPDDANYRALLAFLAEQEGHVELLGLLGDICEFLVGHPRRVPACYEPLFAALVRLQARGTRLVWVEGNHDFHLAPLAPQRFPGLILPDGGCVEIDGQRLFLVHGDQANPDDRGYRRLRAVLRSAAVRGVIRLLPAQILEALADRMSRASRQRRSGKRQRWPARQILPAYAGQLLGDDCRAVICGHFHQPFHERLAQGELVALGDWISDYSYALWEDGDLSLERYTPACS